MNSLRFFFAPTSDYPVTCPNCGESHYESNRFDEALLLELECEASLLLFDGKRDEARALLRAIADVRIENRLRYEYFCLACGAQFDAGGDNGGLL